MSVDWLTIRNHLNVYISQYQHFEPNLREKLTDLQNLMSEGIQNVYDNNQLRRWVQDMIHNSTELSRLMSTHNTDTRFKYEHQTLNINNDITEISQKLIYLSEVIDVIHITQLKQLFVFADPESVLEGFALVSHAPHRHAHLAPQASLTQLFAAFQKLNETT